MLRWLILAGTLLASSAGAGAQGTVADGARYTIEPSDDGFVRLDTETGALSHCTKRDGTWYCEPLPDTVDALAARIDALAAEIAALTARIDALEARIDGNRPLPTNAEALSAEEEREFEEALGFAETLMRRFFEMVREMKREGAGR